MKAATLLSFIFASTLSMADTQGVLCHDQAANDPAAAYKTKLNNFIACYAHISKEFTKEFSPDGANIFCEKLSKKENFIKMDFASPSYQSCIKYHLITAPQKSVAEMYKVQYQNLEKAIDQCTEVSPAIDYSSRSYLLCFYVYGGNHHPGSEDEAKFSLETTAKCGEQTQKFNFNNATFNSCWDIKRRTSGPRKDIVESCLKEAFPETGL
ncbi:MAG: hypothetical protein K2Q18_11870 [Bdellovibrionales bacterium]|nr:hypothetical protein [Bdellovibrionales bacterium]